MSANPLVQATNRDVLCLYKCVQNGPFAPVIPTKLLIFIVCTTTFYNSTFVPTNPVEVPELSDGVFTLKVIAHAEITSRWRLLSVEGNRLSIGVRFNGGLLGGVSLKH